MIADVLADLRVHWRQWAAGLAVAVAVALLLYFWREILSALALGVTARWLWKIAHGGSSSSSSSSTRELRLGGGWLVSLLLFTEVVRERRRAR